MFRAECFRLTQAGYNGVCLQGFHLISCEALTVTRVNNLGMNNPVCLCAAPSEQPFVPAILPGEKAFKDNSSLVRHMRSHSGV